VKQSLPAWSFRSSTRLAKAVTIRSRSTPLATAVVLVALVGATTWFGVNRGISTRPNSDVAGGSVRTCGMSLCIGSTPWHMYGASTYDAGPMPTRAGIKNRPGTITLARQAHLNTIRLVNFYRDTGDPHAEPQDEMVWRRVDAMIAAAGAADMRIDLDLSDYRNVLWNNCISPYTYNWKPFVSFVANRLNTLTGRIYKRDPTIAFVSIAGEPLPVGKHSFIGLATGKPCTITYSSRDLTNFYNASTAEWIHTGATVLVNTGGLGYLDWASGINWKTIFSLRTNKLCDIQTYGGMLAWAHNAASFCAKIRKPLIDEEFGWQQSIGDAQRATLFHQTISELESLHANGAAFWNLGYELAPQSYDVNPSLSLSFTVVRDNAPTQQQPSGSSRGVSINGVTIVECRLLCWVDYAAWEGDCEGTRGPASNDLPSVEGSFQSDGRLTVRYRHLNCPDLPASQRT
jgi:hypothetical protein